MKKIKVHILLLVALIGSVLSIAGMARLLTNQSRVVHKGMSVPQKVNLPVTRQIALIEQPVEQPLIPQSESRWQTPSAKSLMWMSAFALANTMIPFPIIIIPVDKVMELLWPTAPANPSSKMLKNPMIPKQETKNLLAPQDKKHDWFTKK